MFENFSEKYFSLSKFFEAMVENENTTVPNSIILHGPDIIAQYYFALQLARGANCLGDKKSSCECQNCRWIKANEHPEIVTVSKINSKPDGDDSKSVISVKQIEAIKDKLVSSSDYHRFFIFCDAETRDFSESEKEQLMPFENFGLKFPESAKGWVPLGLTKKCFTEIVANALLKSVEEPPAGVTFVFLTENLENIISTIVSRSQAFYVAGNSKQSVDFDYLKEQFANYPNIDGSKALLISEYLMKTAKSKDVPLTSVLIGIQAYLTNLLKNNSQNILLKQKVFEDIDKLQKMVDMLNFGVKEQTVADESGYILTKQS